MKYHIERDTLDFLNDYFSIGTQYEIKTEKYPVILLSKEEGFFSYYIQYLCIGTEDEPKIEELFLNAEIFKNMIDCGQINKV